MNAKVKKGETVKRNCGEVSSKVSFTLIEKILHFKSELERCHLKYDIEMIIKNDNISQSFLFYGCN